jgi:hypothetical protein
MGRLSRLTLVFSVLFIIFITGLPFLSRQFGPYPLMKTQDAVDLLTPLVLIPVYWLLFRLGPARHPTSREILIFMLLAVLWVEGHAMHLAANSIGHHAEAYAGDAVEHLTYFYDEVLSHYLWHAGIIGLSLLLVYRQWRNPVEGPASSLVTETGAGILHGLAFALMVLEGVTVPLGLPAALLVVAFGLVGGRRQFRQQPVLAFFFIAYLTAVIFMLAWRLYWGCFVEPLDALKHLGSPMC